MEIKDIVGLSKPLEKLMDFIVMASKGIFQPFQMKRIAKAESHIRQLEMVDRFKNTLTKSLADYTAQKILSLREQTQLENLLKIYECSAYELNKIQTISDKPIDFEWAVMFSDYAENVSDKEIQVIWGKILAGELSKPGSFSKRTISVLKLLEKEEAEYFMELSKYIVNGTFILEGSHTFSSNYPYYKLLYLRNAGLVAAGTSSCTTYKDEYIFGDVKLRIFNKKDISPLSFNIIVLTNTGMELQRLIKAEHNEFYINDFISLLSHRTKNKHIDYEIVNV